MEIMINGEGSDVINIIMVLTLITVAPFMLLMMTCFARIVIVFLLLEML